MPTQPITILSLVVPLIIGGSSSYGVYEFSSGVDSERIHHNAQISKENSREIRKLTENNPAVLKLIADEDKKEEVFAELSKGINTLNILLVRSEERENYRDKMIEDGERERKEGKRERKDLESKLHELQIKVERISK